MVHDFDEYVERRGTDAKKYNQYGPDVIPMWIADTDFKCPQPVVDAVVARMQEGVYGYTFNSERLKKAGARWQKVRFGWDVDPSWVEYSPGVIGGVICAVRALSQPGDNIVIQTPCYPPFKDLSDHNGRHLLRNALVNVNGRFEVNWEELERMLSDDRTKLFILCNPQNPTGRVFTREELTRMGKLCIMELFESFHGNEIIAALKEQKNKITKVELPNWKESRELLPTWAQSTVIGNIIGIIPGAGMIMAIFMAYNQAVTSNPDKKFGTGVPQGIAAPECANNSVVGSSMVPLLSLGIPGNSSSALFLSALTIQGLRTGPALFNNTPDVAYMIVLGFLLSNIIMLPLAIGYTSLFATAVLRMKREILSGIVIVLCVTGAFAVKNNIFNIYVIIAFGLIGYFFNKFHIPQSPLILASILGKMMESNWVQSMVFSHNNLAVFVTRPLSCALLVISLAFIVIPMIKSAKDKKKGVAKA